jgi:murein DD-endopeptidase MepM/ murein hydrolase activator NlpD
MKKWTVMLIPHDRGERRSFDLSTYHASTLIGVFILLSFVTGFFYQRYRVAEANTETLRNNQASLQTPTLAVGSTGITQAERESIEEKVRAEYDQRDAALRAELGRLYDLETEVRTRSGMPAHTPENSEILVGEGGRGSGPDGPVERIQVIDELLMRPEHVIVGLADPSADLMAQEIDMRIRSLFRLVEDMKLEGDRIDRIPSVWPSDQKTRRLSDRFGNRSDPFTKRLKHHNGLDIAAKRGTPVLVTAKGVVSFSGRDGSYGNYVIVDHGNGLETLYAHMTKRIVVEGDSVEKGESIGTVGSTGRSTGPHIHYEVHWLGKAVNPRNYISN